jgi:hypothetical protein
MMTTFSFLIYPESPFRDYIFIVHLLPSAVSFVTGSSFSITCNECYIPQVAPYVILTPRICMYSGITLHENTKEVKRHREISGPPNCGPQHAFVTRLLTPHLLGVETDNR